LEGLGLYGHLNKKVGGSFSAKKQKGIGASLPNMVQGGGKTDRINGTARNGSWSDRDQRSNRGGVRAAVSAWFCIRAYFVVGRIRDRCSKTISGALLRNTACQLPDHRAGPRHHGKQASNGGLWLLQRSREIAGKKIDHGFCPQSD